MIVPEDPAPLRFQGAPLIQRQICLEPDQRSCSQIATHFNPQNDFSNQVDRAVVSLSMHEMSDLVFQVGLNRAGTQSLFSAVKSLGGYKGIHYQYGNISLKAVLESDLRNNRPIFSDLVDSGVNYFSDFSWDTNLYYLLMYQYPNAKFILTYRDEGSFIESTRKHCAKHRPKKPFYLKYSKCFHGSVSFFMNKHKNDERFLFMNIIGGDGWEKLCPFLNVDVPESPFPNRDEIRNL